jgi:hypothetical protein
MVYTNPYTNVYTELSCLLAGSAPSIEDQQCQHVLCQ